MRRDRWFTLGAIGALLACLSCLTSFGVIVLGAIALGAWAVHLDVVMLPVLATSITLMSYRYRAACRSAP